MTRMLITQGIIATIFPIYLNEHFNLSIALIGFVLSVRTIGLMLGTSGSGFLSERTGSKVVVLAGISTESLYLLMYTIIPLESLMLLTFLEGMEIVFIHPTLTVMMFEQADPERIGYTVGVYRMFMDLGSVIGPVPMMIIKFSFNISGCFFVGVALLLANIPTIIFMHKKQYQIR
jgi:MFS family permease